MNQGKTPKQDELSFILRSKDNFRPPSFPVVCFLSFPCCPTLPVLPSVAYVGLEPGRLSRCLKLARLV
jgi:hypothetical protein